MEQAQEYSLDSRSVATIYNAPQGQDARILIERARALMPEDRVLIYGALDDRRLETMRELTGFFAPEIETVSFPAWDCLPYDRVSPGADIVARRVRALTQLMDWEARKERAPRILFTTINALSQRVMPGTALSKAAFSARKGQRLDLPALQVFLSQNGYTRTDTVRETGEYSIRGGLIDLFPAGWEEPVRLDLFGDDIETLRVFDPLSQTAHKDIQAFALYPVREFFLDTDSIERFRAGYREAFGAVRGGDPLYEAVSEGRVHSGMEHWLPLFYEKMETLFDYAPGANVIFDHHGLQAYEERLAQVLDFYRSRKMLEKNDKGAQGSYHPLAVERLYIEDREWDSRIEGAEIFSPFAPPDQVDVPEVKKARDFADIRALPDGDVMGALKGHLEELNNVMPAKAGIQQSKEQNDLTALDSRLRGSDVEKRKTLIACYSEGARQRLQALMEGAGIKNLSTINDAQDLKKLKPHETGLAILALEHGFTAPDLAVLTEADILGDRLARKTTKRKKAENFLREVSALDEGDLVTHIDHGVGKFLKLETLEAAGTLHDCLKIEYAGGDRLYVPVENIEVLSRFGGDEGTVQLDRLGGAGWQARKARVKKDLMEMADGLLKIAAARQLKKTQPIEISGELYNKFASRFPYQETEDQERSIHKVLDSMAAAHPMDMLVCGDVGFGKTEVALRAAYVAAMDGHQVALVAPTTLLVRQHYKGFMERFEGTGLRIEQLSRLVGHKEAEQVKQGLKDGSVNIVIGTHALFGKGIDFANLGLLIVDEEQRFGVKQKERLKEIKNNVHVLTLTATPIPRTLQMALTGVREMSLITTPPVDRLAVRTFVMPTDTMILREALLREHYRGGQSFYVCPRIKDMPEIEEMLKDHVPEVKFITAHGQMAPADLEDRMSAFYDGQYDVLLATNIIESGIDIPSANTMIIHRADMFGLAQLYQIRGRIGRSNVRAYAYLTYPPHTALNPQAQKRLEVMETLDTLGSGFQLASHDMDIRGAGNLLGDSQSGHIREVGVELYQQMLEEAVAMARQGVDIGDLPAQEDSWSPTMNIGTSVLIPESYVPDLGVRMSLYRRIAELGSSSNVIPEASLRDAQTSGIHKDADKVGDISGSPQSKQALPAAGMTGWHKDIESFAAELIDRFGDLPGEVQNLLDIVAIKQLCRRAGIASIEAGPKGAVIAFHNNAPPNVEALMHWLVAKSGTVKLRPDQKLAAIRHWENTEKRAKGVRSLVRELAELAAGQ